MSRLSLLIAPTLLLAACRADQPDVVEGAQRTGGVAVPVTRPNTSDSTAMANFLRSGPGVDPTSVVSMEPDGRARRIAFPAGSTVRLQPLLVTGRKPGVVAECAVRIGDRVLTTVGEAGSPTEVEECYHLAVAGAMPPEQGHRRLGLIYDSGSPHARFRTPVLLTEGLGGVWKVDEAAYERLDGTSASRSLRDMALVLSQKRNISS